MKTNLLRAVIAGALIMFAQLGYAQKITVTGQVLDASDGQPLIGVGVIPSTGGGTITDYDGNYVIKVEKNASLTFSTLGYVSATEPVNGRTVINVSLSPDSEALDEVVVLGYTSQKKAELSSSVVSIEGEKLRDVSTPDVGNMLQGKVAGVVVMNGSGRPGENAEIRIRGTGSITAGAGPLYVVDGVAGGSFNPNDIETLTVLKDASATALYGASASGGVIVITTKTGSQDRTDVEFKASAGIKRALTGRFHPMTSAELYEFTRTMTDASKFATDYPETLLDQDFDWLGNCFKTGQVQNYYASASGKAGKVNYFLSVDHYYELGTAINTNMRKTSGRLNLSAPISDKLTMTLRLNYTNTHSQDEASYRLIEYSYYAMPWDIPYAYDEEGNLTNEYVYTGEKPIRDDNGEKWWTQNPSNILHTEQYNYSKGHGDSLTGDLQFVWTATDWLTIVSMNRYDTSNSFYESYIDPRTYDGIATKGEYSNSDSESNGWGTTNIAKLHKLVNDHELSGTVGWEYGEGYVRAMGAAGENIPRGMRSLSVCAVPQDISGYDYRTRAWALLSQFQYSYLGKYVATASVRYDESSKFGPKNRGGYFPGASAAWLISREDFMQGNPNFSFLKLRAGYGKTGNDNIEYFKYQEIYNMKGKYNGSPVGYLQQLANPYLGWEDAYMASLGIDATFKNNWNMTVDFYNTINSNLLLEAPVNPTSGFFSAYRNVGKVRNVGMEIATDGTLFQSKDLRWDLSFNLGLNKNRVLELPEHEDMEMVRGGVTQLLREGEDVYSWYMPKWVGVDKETGKPQWERIDEKTGEVSIVNSWDKATPQIVGVASPSFSGGVASTVHWKNFTLSANGNFIVGNKIYNQTRESMDHDGAYIGMNLMSIDNGLGWSRWKEVGDVATHPKPSSGRSDGSEKTSSRFLEDGSFFRVRNVTLSYNLPNKWLESYHLSNARIYAAADNILTLSRFSGMDPEVRMDSDTYHHAGQYSQNYPIPMTVVFGIDVKF